MKLSRQFAHIALLITAATLSACHDASVAPPTPTAIVLVAGNAQSVTAGSAVPVVPTFVVNDESGRPIPGIGVTVIVSAGSGSLANAATKTVDGPTPVGTWTLGQKAGVNTLTVTAAGLPALTITATGGVGAPAKLVPTTPSTIGARVADVVAPAPTARLTDAYDNPVPSTAVTVSFTGGGSAPSSVTSDAQGLVTISDWQLGTIAGQNVLTLTSGAATTSFIANAAPGDPTQIIATSGAQQSAKAGAPAAPVVVRVADRYGNAVLGQSATFTVTAGGGSLAGASTNGVAVASAADGSITAPTWTLGRSAVPQTLHVTSGAFAADVNATIQTDYNIDVRFFGPPMTDQQKAWFTNAAARISGIITGDVPDVTVTNLDVSGSCGIAGLPVMNETIDDLVIYASVASIDGPGKILAESGPCVVRNDATGGLSAVGVMLFDSADMAMMATQGITQDVITHEMLHVVGVGTLWQSKFLITSAGTPSVAYRGASGRQGCVGDGGSVLCANAVPVESGGGPGTADSHWSESVFGNELMTGYTNLGGMPLSAITVGSLADLGYTVNPLAADPYRIPNTGTGTSATIIPSGSATPWERPLPNATVLPGKP